MRKFVLIAVPALVTAAAVGTVAVAQYAAPSATLEGTLTPTAAGTKKKPKRATMRLRATTSAQSRTTADRIELFTPRHSRLNGRGWTFYCPFTEINEEGVGDCPKGSEISRGTTNRMTAAIGPSLLPATFNVRVFFASANELALYLESTALRIQKAIPATITRGGSPYFNKITVIIPPDLQRIGTQFVYVTGLDITLGKTIRVSRRVRGRTVRRTRHAVTVNGCPRDRKHRYELRFHFVPNPNQPATDNVRATDTSNCRGRP